MRSFIVLISTLTASCAAIVALGCEQHPKGNAGSTPAQLASGVPSKAQAEPAAAAAANRNGFTITATVSNLQAVKDNHCVVEDSYVEMTRLSDKSPEITEKMECASLCVTSIAGAADGKQEKPKATLSGDKIVLTAKSLLPGHYLAVLGNWEGMKCMGRLTPILHKGGAPMKIEIPPDAKTPFQLDVGAAEFPLK
jgi:hypothetical protein